MKLIMTSPLSVPMVQLIGSFALSTMVNSATLSPASRLHTCISPSAFAAMMTSLIYLLRPMKALTELNNMIQKGIAGAASIFAFLDEKPESDQGERDLAFPVGHVDYKQVSFSYHPKGAPILDNISFSVKAGETIALVGRSGGGK